MGKASLFFLLAIFLTILEYQPGGADECVGDPFAVCHTFQGTDAVPSDGQFPQAGLSFDEIDGNLYGTTFGGFSGAPGKRCSKSCGNAYRADPGGGDTVFHSFDGAVDGTFPLGELFIDANGNLYGTTEFGPGTGCGGLGCGTLYKFSKDGSSEAVSRLCQTSGCPQGIFPRAGLTADAHAQLYGTAAFGGKGQGWLCGNTYGGCGTVFQLIDSGKSLSAQPLYSFCSLPNCADGAVPAGRLILDTRAGAPLEFFGTTEFGGAYDAGVVFELSFLHGHWKERVLYSFCPDAPVCANGAVPEAGLTLDSSSGALYGTTTYGGARSNGDPVCANDDAGLGCGTVFKINEPYRASNYQVLHAFTGGVGDGQYPAAQLTLDGTTLYGTTVVGGSTNCGYQHGCGTLFSLATAGGDPTILHSFAGVGDGAHLYGALLLIDVQGTRYLYGVARDRGLNKSCCGTLYRYKIQ